MSTERLPDAARAAILAWFDATGRTFPFRGIRDPYAVLVSETMSQQTQIGRATVAWTSFVARFPTVERLAAASPADVLRAWRGLGYNRRALNLQRAARTIVRDHDGHVPRDLDALEALPGIGPYTARAVAALAFGMPVGAVDTNVRRVLGRIVGGTSSMPPRQLQQLADRAVPADRPGDWTHAVMDVGATLCRPARPRCPDCPAVAWCRFAAAGAVGSGSERSVPAAAPTGSAPFASTARWLRGRLMDALRDAGDTDGWLLVAPPIGEHGAEAVDRALMGMVRDGLVERDPSMPMRARLPVE
jgi:A/G-specific adenine glycosylase